MVLLVITILLTIVYTWLIFHYWKGWKQVPGFSPGNNNPGTRITVIIPARNEETTIPVLLDSLELQSYPRVNFEVIVVDDHSEDSTAIAVKKYNAIRLISLNEDHLNAYKKKAIETGIQAATGDLIVTTDADCTAERDWLRTIS